MPRVARQELPQCLPFASLDLFSSMFFQLSHASNANDLESAGIYQNTRAPNRMLCTSRKWTIFKIPLCLGSCATYKSPLWYLWQLQLTSSKSEETHKGIGLRNSTHLTDSTSIHCPMDPEALRFHAFPSSDYGRRTNLLPETPTESNKHYSHRPFIIYIIYIALSFHFNLQ